MLEDEGKASLINFVLKSRLSESANLRMNVSYTSVSDLVKDLRERLLTKKSDTAILQKMLRARQDRRTIEEFGREIEQLLVDLTISQANGNSKNYEILKTINEKNAIKQFSDELLNTRISTIIAARDYSSLKDAIRGALDEVVTSSQEPQVMTFYRGRGNFNLQRGHNSYNNRNYNSPFRGHSTFRGRSTFRGSSTGGNSNTREPVRGNNQGSSFRGRENSRVFSNRSNYRGHNYQNGINMAQLSLGHSTELGQSSLTNNEQYENDTCNENDSLFFRS